MEHFKAFGKDLTYTDSLQLDAAFSVAHVNYNKSPIFNKVIGKNLANESRKNNLLSQDKIENILECLDLFKGTEENFKKNDRISLWKNYWLEYINAFNNLADSLPSSVVTVTVGRQAVEIGFKYLLLKKTGKINKTHHLGNLAQRFFEEYEVDDDYMECVDTFCEKFCKYIEGGNDEYFRYPEYKNNVFFAGNCLDIKWLSYNLALIILKLLHFANLDTEV